MVTVPLGPPTDDLRTVLDEHADLSPGAPIVPDTDLRALYRHLLLIRTLDERMLRLQRQGRLGFYMTSTGEEATHLAVYALRPSDWVFPSYREPGAALWRGYTVKEFICQLYANAADLAKGRQMPVHHAVRRINYVSVSSPVGTQIPQAVGMAMAARISGKEDVALVYFGEGATSTGEYHVGLNFAGVFKAPVVFFCRNNGWAISVPAMRQTASETFAQKAAAYGFPGVRVDGNDLMAVIQVTQEAVARARSGEGPTLIEAITYRRGAHSSSDDPSAYRDTGEPKAWEDRDPIERFRRHLERRGLWTSAWDVQVRAEIDGEITRAHDEAQALPPPPLESLVEDVYEHVPPSLARQRNDICPK